MKAHFGNMTPASAKSRSADSLVRVQEIPEPWSVREHLYTAPGAGAGAGNPALRRASLLALAAVMLLPGMLTAQSSTNSQVVEADTFVSSGDPNSNFGALGAAEIAAPTAAQNRTEIALLRFNTSALQSGFDLQYGAGNWTVTSVSLRLFSNVNQAGQQPSNARFNRIAAGAFELDLLSNNNWSETAITWNSLPTILPGANNSNTLTPLGTFLWDANGEASSTWSLNIDPDLTGKIYNGDEVTIMGQPTANSTVGYLFNTLMLAPGDLDVSVQAVPEPSTPALIAGLACVMTLWIFRRNTQGLQRCG